MHEWNFDKKDNISKFVTDKKVKNSPLNRLEY